MDNQITIALIKNGSLPALMSHEYPYVPVGGKFFCLKINLFALTWILLVRGRNLHLDSLGIRRRRVPSIIKTLIINRTRSQFAPDDGLSLPVLGHICMRVHHGYKVFNLTMLTVTKVFDEKLNTAAASSEITSVSDASPLVFTPRLISSDSGHRWYTETFIPGKRSSKKELSDPQALYKSVIADYLLQIILSKPINTISLAEYCQKIRDSIYQQLLYLRLDDEISTGINNFIGQTTSRLKASKGLSIQLAFTHGDFSFVNFLNNDGRIVVIDWESAQHRSVLHDLYNYFLTELYYRRTHSNLLFEMDDAVLLLYQHLTSNMSERFSDFVKFQEVYRWLYYLERIHMLLDREPSVVQLNVIKRSLEVFKDHESNVSRFQSTL